MSEAPTGNLAGRPILVTGATGLIGSNLLPRLLALGARVRATRHRTAPASHDPRVEWIHADLTRPEDCARAVEGQEVVVLAAAHSSGAAVIVNNPLAHVTPNVLIATLLLDAAWRAGVRKVVWFASTTGYPPSDRPLREDEMFVGDPYERYFFVGWTKRFVEKLCEMYGARLAPPMPTVVLRPTNVYGPGDKFDFATSHVLPALVRRVVERHDPIEVWGTGQDVRDLIYVDDMVEAVLCAIARIDAYDVFNIGAGSGISVRELLDLILELDSYRGARVTFDSSKPSVIPKRLVDVSKAERVLGFRPRVDLREGLRRTIAWYRATRGLARPA